MLATYGALSFGSLAVTGSFTPRFFPRPESELARYRALARRIAQTVAEGGRPKPNSWNRKMFQAMKRKMGGMHAMNYILDRPMDGQPDPSRFLVRLIRRKQQQAGIPRETIEKMTRNATFEYEWWKARGWLRARSFSELAAMRCSEDFDVRSRLLDHRTAG